MINYKKGYRGYIFSNKIGDSFIPQRVQNLVIKDYAIRNKLFYKLSATEYKSKEQIHLKNVLKKIHEIEGMIFYSIFMLPENTITRNKIYNKFILNNKKIHFALEEMVIKNKNDIKMIEEIIMINKKMNEKKN